MYCALTGILLPVIPGGMQTGMIGASKNVYLSSLVMLWSVFTSAHALGGDSVLNYVCEKGSATRSVAVVSDPEFACRVRYTKSSIATFPWGARNDPDYCHSKAIGLVEKLASLGWECDSAEDVRSILVDQIDRYGRHINFLNSVDKTCSFYPDEAQFGNLCGDEREEAAIIYTCDADIDNWNQHLAIFLEVESDPVISEVGGSDYRLVSSYYIENNSVMMETEKIDPAGNSSTAQNPVQQTSIQCLYSAGSGWQLIER